MALPDPEGFRMHVHEVCNNAYCIKRFALHIIPFSYTPLNEERQTLQEIL